MPWHVRVTARAEKDLAGLPMRDREAVWRALRRIADNFGALDVHKLGGRGNEWRLRVGRWRVRLELDNAAGAINVLRVQDRKAAYRD
jgi:mRNA-degrading endonuclease RelE of RelBE toxin-antitoxin system